MRNSENLYRNLQIHLDKQTIGFPATKSGSDIRLLKQLFPPEQAEMAMLLTYKFESLEQIYERAKELGVDIKEVESVLDETARRGTIGYRNKEGIKQYKNIPYIIGMGEAAALDPTPEILKAMEDYSNDLLFWGAFISSKIPQMRVVPIEESIAHEKHISTYDEIKNIIKTTTDPIGIIECVCRKSAKNRGEPCKKTSRTQTCMVLQDGAKNFVELGLIEKFSGKIITKEEALEILRKNEEEGLVLQPSNAQNPDFICSCCGCCCGILTLHKALPNPVSYWATNYYAKVDPELCGGCGLCVEQCQVEAMKINKKKGTSIVDLKRCLGCGNCIPVCPNEAIELQKKEKETIPPQTGEDMFEIIMTNKK